MQHGPASEGPPAGARHDGAGWKAGFQAAANSAPILRKLLSVARNVRDDVQHRRRLSRPTHRLRAVIVAGGGQLDDFWGGAFGHPYVLWRWARRARATGGRFLVLSVGTGSLSTPLARRFVHRALSAADYRSFRDEKSRDLVGDPLVLADPVVPDLAYGLDMRPFRVAHTAAERPIVGISPIAYCDPRVWPIRDGERYRRYLERLGALAARVLQSNHDLLLFGTDGPDNVNVEDLLAELFRQVPVEQHSRIRTVRVTTHQELFRSLAGVRAVVASRLHGVLLSHLMGIPVLALSYERKVSTLMTTMSHEEYCLPIDHFTPAAAHDKLLELVGQREPIARHVLSHVEQFRRQVLEQYDRVLPREESAT